MTDVLDDSRQEERRSRRTIRRTKRLLRDIDRPITDLASHPTEAVTPKVLAAYPPIACDVRTIIRMVDAGALVGYKVGREWRVTIASARKAFHMEQHGAAS